MLKLNSSIISYERGRRLLQLLFCLFLAFVIWSVHNLSEEYSHLFQYTVVAKSSMSGKFEDSQSINKLTLRARASGFYILKHRYNRVDASLELSPDNKLFKKIVGKNDSYYLLTSELRAHISEATADKLQVEYLSTDTLFFLFPGVVSKEVPVAFKSRISFREQYMQRGELKLEPLRVTIYGEQSELDKVDSAYTQLIVMKNVSTSLSGVAGITPVAGVTISPKELLYSINVVRYVEKELMLPVTMINLPEGFVCRLNPSEIRINYRFPLEERESLSLTSTSLYVNYNSIEGVFDTIVTPVVENLPKEILGYTLYPGYVSSKVYPTTQVNK